MYFERPQAGEFPVHTAYTYLLTLSDLMNSIFKSLLLVSILKLC